jgi:hypothetical protein
MASLRPSPPSKVKGGSDDNNNDDLLISSLWSSRSHKSVLGVREVFDICTALVNT